MKLLCKFCRYHHSHIITIRTLLPTFWSMFDSLDPGKEVLHIICPLNIRDILDLTDFYKCLIALVVLAFWLDIRVIPKTDDIIFVTELEDRHRHIRTTTDMDEDFWFFLKFWTIEAMFEDILGNLSRHTTNDKFLIFIKKMTKSRVFGDNLAKLCRGNVRNMRIGKKLKILNSILLRHCEGRSNPVIMGSSFLFLWIASFFAMTEARNK